MKKFIRLISLFLLFYWNSTIIWGATFSHPGLLNSKEELEYIKKQIQKGKEPWKSALEKLKSSKYANLDYKYEAFDYVICGSYNNPNIGCSHMVEDGMAAYAMTLIWYFTDDNRYLDKAKEIIFAWANKYIENQESNSILVVSWSVPWYVGAMEIMRYMGGNLTNSELTNFDKFVDKLYSYVKEDYHYNNWVHSEIEAHIAIAIYKDDKAEFDRAIERWKTHVETYIYESSDGPYPKDVRNRSAAEIQSTWRSSASKTDYIDGLGMETCRDFGHLMLGFNSMIYAAHMAWQQGVDLFKLQQKRLSDFMELHAKWTLGVEEVPSNICDGVIKCSGSSDATMPCGATNWDIAYRHLHNRLNVSLPYTKQMLDQSRPGEIAKWNKKPETLIAGDVPFNFYLPDVFFVKPSKDTIIKFRDSLVVEVEAKDKDILDSITRVDLYVNNNFVRSEKKYPYTWNHKGQDLILSNLSVGENILKAVAYTSNKDSNEAIIKITVVDDATNIKNTNDLLTNNLKVYPNPIVNDNSNILYYAPKHYVGKILSFQIYTLSGKLVSQFEQRVEKEGNNIIHNKLNNLKKGSYVLIVREYYKELGRCSFTK